MIILAILLAALAALVIWRLGGASLTAKPWLEQGVIGDLADPRVGDFADPETRRAPAAKTALLMFLAVVGCLFTLLAAAYAMRMADPDWRPAPLPTLVWINTGVLILSSLALQSSVDATRRGEARRARLRLLEGAGGGMLFLIGQLLAWRQFAAAGFFLSTNPSSSFFYLLTGLHGAHLAGGLAALGWTVAKSGGQPGGQPELSREGVALCALYWHFLLVVWLILLALLTGWAGDFVAFCRGLAS